MVAFLSITIFAICKNLFSCKVKMYVDTTSISVDIVSSSICQLNVNITSASKRRQLNACLKSTSIRRQFNVYVTSTSLRR